MTDDNSTEQKFPKISEMCLAGACNRGISYIGCFAYLEEMKLLELKKIVGVSIGSFIAACFITGYTSDELFDSVINKDMNVFKDYCMGKDGALLKGEEYKNWVYDMLSKKCDPNITMKELYKTTGIEFILTTTCVYAPPTTIQPPTSTQPPPIQYTYTTSATDLVDVVDIEVCDLVDDCAAVDAAVHEADAVVNVSEEEVGTDSTDGIKLPKQQFKEGIVYLSHIHTPDMPLYVAVNCSMAFPFVFPPVFYEDCQFIDGGVLDNFPMDMLSTDAVGMKSSYKNSDGSDVTKNPLTHLGKIFELVSNRFVNLKMEKHQNIFTINCTDFDVIDFGMSLDDKITLYMRGYEAMKEFIERRQQTQEQTQEQTQDQTQEQTQ